MQINQLKIKIIIKTIPIFLFFVIHFHWIAFAERKNKENHKEAESIVSRYSLTFREVPKKIPHTFSVDAPLLGNGSFGVAIAGPPEEINFYLARNDFWRLKHSYNESYPSVLGKLQMKLPQLKGADYQVKQDLYTATTYFDIKKNNVALSVKTFVYANEDLLLITLKNNGKDSISGEINLVLPGDETSGLPSVMRKSVNKNIQYITRHWEKDVDIKTMASCVLKMIDCTSPSFNIKPHEKLFLALSTSSNFKHNDCLEFTQKQVNGINKDNYSNYHNLHKEWWNTYWNKSFVEIEDKTIEKAYYQSLYVIGSASRDLEFPPGIFGTWVTKERPEWNGDYHLNYNHQAPYYALFSSNRIEQALPYNYPLLAIADRTRKRAKKLFGIDGIYMPVGVGPKGIEVTYSGPGANKRQFYEDHGFLEDGGLYFFQKSNALHCINNMSMLCYYTYNPDYIKLVYPFIKGVVQFWEGYLVYEKGRYVIKNDACAEGPNGDVNNILTLGFLRNALQTVIDMSRELGIDEEKRPTWENIQKKLSKYPVYHRNGKTYYADSEKGNFSHESHAGLWEIIFPGNQFHLDSKPEKLKIAKNSIDYDRSTNHLWTHQLFTCFSFAVAARVGMDPDTITNHLHDFIANKMGENGFRNESPVGIETCSMTPLAVNEMLLRSHPEIIHVFPVYNSNRDARFQDLRAEGGFLVSSELKNREVQYIKIKSEQGRSCKIVNPWNSKKLIVCRNGNNNIITVRERFELQTKKGDLLIIKPCN